MFSSAHGSVRDFEDEHLLVVSKPAGWNTHAPVALCG